jgi:hypothetical protein
MLVLLVGKIYELRRCDSLRCRDMTGGGGGKHINADSNVLL